MFFGFQVISAILTNPQDRTKISLLCANHSEDDILLRWSEFSTVSKYRVKFMSSLHKNAQTHQYKLEPLSLQSVFVGDLCPMDAGLFIKRQVVHMIAISFSDEKLTKSI